MHTAEVTVSPSDLNKINELRRAHDTQDQREQEEREQSDDMIVDHQKDKRGHSELTRKPGLQASILDLNVKPNSKSEGGALWDIFRREDSSKVQEYLKKHHKEFRHTFCSPVEQVVHPIHDQTFYLNAYHKQKLKEEFGVEPWAFVQNLGEAVFIPAGCPHQVRNLKSCKKVAMDFVSPENIQECVRLTEDFRILPHNHRAKEDKLEVKKMTLHALKKAVEELERLQQKALKD